jgi:hypothetical protein
MLAAQSGVLPAGKISRPYLNIDGATYVNGHDGKGGPSASEEPGNRPPANREKETKPQDAPNSVWAILPIGKRVFRLCFDANGAAPLI